MAPPQPENITFMEARIQDMTETARLYLRGAYAVTVGEPLTFTGGVEDRDHVRAIADQIMAQIGALAQESRQRLPLAGQEIRRFPLSRHPIHSNPAGQ